MRDYKYEMLEKTTKLRQLSGEIHELSEEVMKDGVLFTKEKWEIIAQAQKYVDKEFSSIPQFDIDIFQRFNTDHILMDHSWRKCGISDYDGLKYNYITTMLIEKKYYNYDEIIYAYDFLKKLEAIRELKTEDVMFYRWKKVIKTDLGGNKYLDEVEECMVLSNEDLDNAREWFMREGIYFFRFKSDDL